jgi:hypothetical protein
MSPLVSIAYSVSSVTNMKVAVQEDQMIKHSLGR